MLIEIITGAVALSAAGELEETRERQTNRDELDDHVMAMSFDIGCGRINGFFTGGRPEVARAVDGGSPFELGLPKRAGKFGEYIRGGLQCYHCSYWATVRGILRRTANLRKNPGFAMPAVGIDRIGGTGPGPHRVRLLKVGGRIQLETQGRLALVFEDDGNTHGPKLGDGYIGLRQMAHSRRVSYTHFKVWKVEPKQ